MALPHGDTRKVLAEIQQQPQEDLNPSTQQHASSFKPIAKPHALQQQSEGLAPSPAAPGVSGPLDPSTTPSGNSGAALQSTPLPPTDAINSLASLGGLDMDALVQATVLALQKQLSLNPDAPDLSAMDESDRTALGKSTIAALQQLLLAPAPESYGSTTLTEAQGETFSATPQAKRVQQATLSTPSLAAPGGLPLTPTSALPTGARASHPPLTPGSVVPTGMRGSVLPLTPASVMPVRKPAAPMASCMVETEAEPENAPVPRAGRQAPRARVSDLSEVMLALGHAIQMAPNARVPHEVGAHATAILAWTNTTFGGPLLNRVADELNADSTDDDDSGEEEEMTSSTAQGRGR